MGEHRGTGILVRMALSGAMVVCTARAATAQSLPPPTRSNHGAPMGTEAFVMLGASGLDDFSSNAFASRATLPDVQFGAGPTLVAGMGYRYLPWLSSGATFQYGYHPLVTTPARASSAHGDSLVVGLYTRAYIGSAVGWRWIDPWVGAAFVPVAMIWEGYQLPNATVQLTVVSLAATMSIGFDVNVTRTVAIGAMADGSWWFPLQRCAFVSVMGYPGPAPCAEDHLRSERAWTLGLTARFTIEP